MRSIKFNLSKKPPNAWDAAVLLVEAYISANLKADQILELLPDDFIGQARANCQSLFIGALRHGHRTRFVLQPLFKKSPKPRVEAVLLLAGYEIFSEPKERHPKIVHHAVERSKKLVNRFELKFLNAVLRKLPAAIETLDAASHPAAANSHPDWLATRWINEFGPESAQALMQWNQQIPEQTIRIYEQAGPLPDELQATEWTGFYRIARGTNWQEVIAPLLNNGTAYIKDPSTRLAPELLSPATGSDLLDLCAAPGGKSYDLGHLMQSKGRIVAVDLPGSRIGRLKENLETLGIESRVIECDLLQLRKETFAEQQLPEAYDAVMLDAPCSNTGVIQRRTDVKWRLQPDDIGNCAKLQLELLQIASRFVKPNGRLVYSTCSIETEENQSVVDNFLESAEGKAFQLKGKSISYPWETGHDGAGAFLLERSVG